MRNTLPPLWYVQELETSLAGNIGVAIEGSNATVSGDDAWRKDNPVLSSPPLHSQSPCIFQNIILQITPAFLIS
jgi:hypothetical protein